MEENDKQLLSIVSANIKEARKKLGISQLELAGRCDLSQSYIGEIESCKKFPSLKTIGLIAENLELKPYQLLLDEELKMITNRDYLYSSMRLSLGNQVSDLIEDFFSRYEEPDGE